MRINGSEFLQPVFDFLDGIIRDYGDILFMLFTYAAIPFLVWVLCGGLRNCWRESAARMFRLSPLFIYRSVCHDRHPNHSRL